jgi:hypothetical protein
MNDNLGGTHLAVNYGRIFCAPNRVRYSKHDFLALDALFCGHRLRFATSWDGESSHAAALCS